MNKRAFSLPGVFRWWWLLLPALFACFSLENQLDLRADGSGTLALSYHLPPGLLALSPDTAATIPLPLTREDFTQTLRSARGLVLKSYHQQREEEEILIKAVLTFKDPGDLAQLWGEGEQEPYVFHKIPGKKEMNLIIPRAGGFSAESLALVEELFAGAYLAYRIAVPGQITAYNAGSLENRKTIVYKIALCDIFKAEKDQQIHIEWQ